jgi:hypothetical protein
VSSTEPANIGDKIDVLNELAWLLVDTNLKRAYALSETAYDLASSSDGDNPPYQVGLAYSLRTQGYLKPVYPLKAGQLAGTGNRRFRLLIFSRPTAFIR